MGQTTFVSDQKSVIITRSIRESKKPEENKRNLPKPNNFS